ncbi:dihydrodipicolinate synthase family protein [Saccharomonospora piscinae]|uniref:dihydrodipicolinate synthase family protein n=1 Tax=Saccharomonospora piscinae TaxID=687388 RepID=UPI001106C1E0|nr:dihydrodipicolinate synthase family protein [Saccharomonospora piscinae]TLW91039.1 dihydrodipicolinate synthase family protein [Saccharomonospora piscinae]
MAALPLPTAEGGIAPWSPSGRGTPGTPASPPASRVAYAAAHVVADPFAGHDPTDTVALDWDTTLAFRRHLWSCGLGVAEAMDTAQRGMGLDWATTRELVRRTGAEARACGGRWVAGVGTDQLPAGPSTVDQIVTAWGEQLALVSGEGAVPVVMASRALAATASGPDDYHRAYGALLSQADGPVLLHWLGEQFDPALRGYWGHTDVDAAAAELAALCAEHESVVAGVKVSVLDADVERRFRDALPGGVACYTGDDFHYPELIAGDDSGHSEALLGIFDPIAPVAGAALARLDAGDADGFRALLDPTVALSREIFRSPTPHYKVGVVFLAYLAGHQPHFRMVGGLESARTITHLSDLLRLADVAGVLPDPDLAVTRMRPLLAAAGVSL